MIALGSDHGGLALKRHVMEYLDARGLEYQDFGCYTAESLSLIHISEPTRP